MLIQAVRRGRTKPSTKHRQNDALASSSVNPHASTYRELLNVPDMVAAGEDVKPPLARGMSDAKIMISEISSSTPEFPPTQSTERAVKVTTKASAVFLSGVERQDGAAINKRVYRQGLRHADEIGGGDGTRWQQSQDFLQRVTHTKNRKLSGFGPLFP